MFLLVVTSLMSVATAAFSKEKTEAKLNLIERTLPKEVGDDFCRGDFSFRTLWTRKIYDAQVEGVLIRTADKGMVPAGIAEVRAKDLAKSLGHGGYASGVCRNGTAWAASLPSHVPLNLNTKSRVLDLNLRPRCDGTLEVNWAHSDVGVSQKIKAVGSGYSLPLKKDGFVSVVCNHKNKQLGPVEFFLAPVGSPKLELPEVKALIGSESSQKVLNWVNSLRRKEKLREVMLSDESSKTAEILSGDDAVAHNMAKLVNEQKRLKNKGLILLGEDRSRAASLEEALTLLWFSPVHRDLLLNVDAKYLGIMVKQDRETFVELVFVNSN